MAGPASNFILNIVELQNTITSASGLTPLASLSNTVSRLQEMVIYDEKRIAANTISAYTAGSPITVQDSLSMVAGATLTVGGSTITGGGGGATVDFGLISSIGWGPSLLQFTSTDTAGATAVAMQVGAAPGTVVPLRLTADGILRLPIAGTPAPGKYLTCMDGAGTAQWQTPALPSDRRLKGDIRPLEGAGAVLDRLQGVSFYWIGREAEGSDIGFLAQDVRAVMPPLVEGGSSDSDEDGELRVHYQKVIPLLVEEIKSLRRRVSTLEGSRAEP